MLLYFFSTIDSYVVYHLYVDHGTRYSFSYYWFFFHTFNLIKLMLSFISSNGYTNSMSSIHLLYQFYPFKNFTNLYVHFKVYPFQDSIPSGIRCRLYVICGPHYLFSWILFHFCWLQLMSTSTFGNGYTCPNPTHNDPSSWSYLILWPIIFIILKLFTNSTRYCQSLLALRSLLTLMHFIFIINRVPQWMITLKRKG